MARAKAPAWTAREIAILHDVFPREGINGAADALPDRSWQAINVMASKLGILSGRVGDAPRPVLSGARLEEAIRLREELNWSFGRIGATLGVSESAACNAVLIALCPRKGFTPAARDVHGFLTADGLERLRLMLRKGLKAMDIQLRLGISASCVAEQRRRYRADLKARGKAPLPMPGAGERYSGVPVSKAARAEAERLFMTGLGTKKVAERSSISKTTATRIRNRLIKRLSRKGEVLPGCDAKGVRRVQAESTRFIPAEAIAALRADLLLGVPVKRSAAQHGIGQVSAYRVRDELRAELAERGETLPRAQWRGAGQAELAAEAAWLPKGTAAIYRYRALSIEIGAEAAKAQMLRDIEAEQQAEREAAARERARPRTFEEKLAAVARGAGLQATFVPRRPDPSMTLGGIASAAL